MDNDKSIWNKTESELTVGDHMKINGTAVAAVTGITMVIVGGITLADKIREHCAAKKAEKKKAK